MKRGSVEIALIKASSSCLSMMLGLEPSSQHKTLYSCAGRFHRSCFNRLLST